MEPTILVKKADGTTVRMTLAEFRARQKLPKHPSTQAPKHPNTLAPRLPSLGSGPGGQAEHLSKKAQEHESMKAVAKKPLHHNITTSQHHTSVPKPVKPHASPKDWTADDHKSLLEPEFSTLPVPAPEHALSTSAPVKRIFVDEAKAAQIRNPKSEIRNPGTKPAIHDITSPVPKKSVGPGEEFAAFTLTDFYRLAPTTEAAVSRLKEKFDTWKQESYLLFLDVREAWYQSPLYRQYVDMVFSALNNRKKITDLAPGAIQGKHGGFTSEVLQAVVAVNRYLNT